MTQTMTSAAPARAKITSLVAAGTTTTAIARVAGLTRPAVDDIASGRTTMLRSYTAGALDEVTLAACIAVTPPRSLVPSTGTIRRVEGLLAMGWTHDEIHARTGIATRRLLRDGSAHVTAATHRTIEDLFSRLCMTPGPSAANRARAHRYGWVSPLAWDNIDDPDETPSGVAA